MEVSQSPSEVSQSPSEVSQSPSEVSQSPSGVSQPNESSPLINWFTTAFTGSENKTKVEIKMEPFGGKLILHEVPHVTDFTSAVSNANYVQFLCSNEDENSHIFVLVSDKKKMKIITDAFKEFTKVVLEESNNSGGNSLITFRIENISQDGDASSNNEKMSFWCGPVTCKAIEFGSFLATTLSVENIDSQIFISGLNTIQKTLVENFDKLGDVKAVQNSMESFDDKGVEYDMEPETPYLEPNEFAERGAFDNISGVNESGIDSGGETSPVYNQMTEEQNLLNPSLSPNMNGSKVQENEVRSMNQTGGRRRSKVNRLMSKRRTKLLKRKMQKSKKIRRNRSKKTGSKRY